MKKGKNYNNLSKFFNLMLLAVAFVWTILFVITGASIDEGYNLSVGSVSPKRFVATREVVNEYATEQKRQEAMDSVASLYKHDLTVMEEALLSLGTFFDEMDQRIAYEQLVQQALENEEELPASDEEEGSSKSSIFISTRNMEIYRSLSLAKRANLRQSVLDIAESAFEQGIKDDTLTKSIQFVQDEFQKLEDLTDDEKNMGYSAVSTVLRVNLIVDEEATQNAKLEKAAEVPNVIILKNQKIVDENEVITAEIFSVLESLGLVSTGGNNIVPIAGSILITLLLFVIASMYLFAYHKQLLDMRNETLLLFTLYCLMIAVMGVMASMNYYLVPVTLFAMLVSILLSTRLAVFLHLCVVGVGAFICKGDMDFLLFFQITGAMSALLIDKTEKRNMVLPVGLAIGIVHVAAYFGLAFFFGKGYTVELVYEAFIAAAIGLLSVVATVGSLPFWEAVFGVVTPLKLLELTDSDSEIMRKLMIEAPGTYHHSLMVANLAETAAYDIEADAILARVGAYYHDIGKTACPQFFGENLAGPNPHDEMLPGDSVNVIKGHTAAGMELAKKYKIPAVVRNMIVEHHGTTLIKYFYYKAVKDFGEENVNKADFQYHGVIPQSRESGIVMLADTVEAAVRATISKGNNMEEVRALIKSLIKDKLDEGQLLDSGFTIKDLQAVEDSFVKVFSGMYHERVQYPKAKKEEKDPIREEYEQKLLDEEDGGADESFS